MIESKQHVCDMMCEAIRATSAGGTGNALKEIRYIKVSDGYEVARPIFEDGSGSDGYYDVNITYDSGIAIIKDIVKQFVKEVW